MTGTHLSVRKVRAVPKCPRRVSREPISEAGLTSYPKLRTYSCATAEAKVAEHGMALRPIPADEDFAVLERQGRRAPFTRLAGTCLQQLQGCPAHRRGNRPAD